MVTQWIADLESGDSNVRSLALQKLKELGPEARTAVPTLVAALQKAAHDWPLASAIAETLGAIGPDARAAVPFLASFPDAVLRIGGEQAQERLAVRSMLLMVENAGSWWDAYPTDLWERWGKDLMRPYAERIIPCLVELLTDSEERVRTRAAETLAGYGGQAANTVPALLAALNDLSPGGGFQYALREICFTLRKLGEDPVPHLLSLMRQHTGPKQLSYLDVLWYMGESAIPVLRQELRGSSVAGRVPAARSLGSFAGQAQAAIEDLVAVLSDPDAELRREAALALVEIDPARAGPAVPGLLALLESTGEDTPDRVYLEERLRSVSGATVRVKMVKLLARIGSAAEPAVLALTSLLSDPEVRLEAALALVEINARHAAPAVPVLMDVLQRYFDLDPASTSAPAYWPTLLDALGRIGVPAAAAAPLIRKFLENSDPVYRVSAATALGRVAPDVPELKAEAVRTLLPLVADVDDVQTFWEALAALAEIGPAAREVVPQLELMLFDEQKRGITDAFCPGDPEALLFSALVKIDATAAARVLEDPRASEGLRKGLGRDSEGIRKGFGRDEG